jgi:hypothetical protein
MDVAIVDGVVAGVGRYDGSEKSTQSAASSFPAYVRTCISSR